LAATLAALIALVAEIWLYLKTEIFHDAVLKKREERKAKRILDNTVARALGAPAIDGKKTD
jgi:hypothetical protein